VVEGTGDHGCEYMTGGRVVVLGRVGRNFAAGMSGGIAYVLNVDGAFTYYCNQSMVELSAVYEHEDQWVIRSLLEKHIRYTGSVLAQRILDSWHTFIPRFIKVMPIDYKRVQEAQLQEQPRDHPLVMAEMTQPSEISIHVK
jgi:glutamate synthase (NADPH/NADH) large chain